MSNTKSIGDIAEINITAKFLEQGIPVSIPYGDNCPYDLIIDVDGLLLKVQIKHGKYKNGCVIADVRQRHGANRLAYSTYAGKADYIAIWCSELHKAYLVPLNICEEKTCIYLRVDQHKVRSASSPTMWAEDFLLEEHFSSDEVKL